MKEGGGQPSGSGIEITIIIRDLLYSMAAALVLHE